MNLFRQHTLIGYTSHETNGCQHTGQRIMKRVVIGLQLGPIRLVEEF